MKLSKTVYTNDAALFTNTAMAAHDHDPHWGVTDTMPRLRQATTAEVRLIVALFKAVQVTAWRCRGFPSLGPTRPPGLPRGLARRFRSERPDRRA